MRICIAAATPALDVLVKFADWIDAPRAGVPDDRFQKMLDREHGGMNEVLADVSRDHRRRRATSKLARRFSHRALLEPLARGDDTLDGLHANTQIPKVIGFSRIYELTAVRRSSATARRNSSGAPWSNSAPSLPAATATSNISSRQHEFAKHLGSAKTMETCCTHNMLRLTRALYARDPHVALLRLLRTRAVQRHPRLAGSRTAA